jgi:hypothetical protein
MSPGRNICRRVCSQIQRIRRESFRSSIVFPPRQGCSEQEIAYEDKRILVAQDKFLAYQITSGMICTGVGETTSPQDCPQIRHPSCSTGSRWGLRPRTLLQMSRDSYPVHCGCGLRSSLSHAHASIRFPEPALSSRQLLGQVRAGGDLISILGSKTCCGPLTRNHP